MTKQPRLAAGRARALGLPTRGTTNPNRLRRMDNWIVREFGSALRTSPDPLVIDLGYGEHPATSIELLSRVRRVAPAAAVLGLEIDPARVAAAKPAEREGLTFERGGFELAGRRALIVRVANVLRQYPEAAVAPAWEQLRLGLSPGGVVVEGTCDELGRRATWVAVDGSGPVSLTLACRVSDIERPSDLAPRLVKALIHRNVPGEPVHAFLRDLDHAWELNAATGAFGPRQRWRAMCNAVASQWPLLSGPAAHRAGEITVSWESVAPGSA